LAHILFGKIEKAHYRFLDFCRSRLGSRRVEACRVFWA
jgi:hypothetical protein